MSKKDIPYSSQLKGVAVLLGDGFSQTENITNSSTIVSIDLIELPKSQPRRYFDSQKLEELSNSIKEFGILEPLLVRPLSNDRYELVAGERRYRAATLAGLNRVPIVSKEMDEETAFQVRLVENLQREDLNPLEETEGILELLSIKLGVNTQEIISVLNSAANAKKRNLDLTENVFRQLETIESIFSVIGKLSAESFRVSRLPLLNLPTDVVEALRQGQIEYTKARAIARLKDEDQRKQLLEDAIAHNFTLNEIKQQIKEVEQQSQTTNFTPSLKERADDTWQRFKKSKLWDDPKKKSKVEKLLSQIEVLINEE